MPLSGTNNSSLPQACHSLLSSIWPHTLFCITCPLPADSGVWDPKTACVQVLTGEHGGHGPAVGLFPRYFFLPSSSQNFRNWLLFLSFWFNLYIYFLNKRKKISSDFFFPLMLEFIFYLYFSSIWKLTSDHLLGMGTRMRKASAMRNVITFLLIIILPSLILVLQPPFIEILFIGRDIFLASPLSISQFWTSSKLFSEAESLLGVIFFHLPSFSSN